MVSGSDLLLMEPPHEITTTKLRDITRSSDNSANMTLNILANPKFESRIHTLHHFESNEQYNILTQDIHAQKNQILKLELDVARKNDELNYYNSEVEQEAHKLNELDQFEIDSMTELDQKLKLSKAAIVKQYESKINELKSSYKASTDEVKRQNLDKFTSEKNEIQQIYDDLSLSSKQVQIDHNRRMIRQAEEYNIKKIDAIKQKDLQILEKKKLVEKTIKQNQLSSQKIDELSDEIKLIDDDIKSLTDEHNNIKSKSSSNQQTIVQLQDKLKTKYQELNDITNNIKIKDQKRLKLINDKNLLNEKLMVLETLRRDLHNKLQELKGNIRVFCRIRPIFNSNLPLISIDIPNNNLNDEGCQILNLKSNDKSQSFYFDRIFNQSLSNQLIFNEIWQLIQSSLDGYNVCVFAYGQTGSGKTFTMSQHKSGIIPLSIGKLFIEIENLKNHDWTYTIEGQFMEIYNETIVDLLSPNDSAKHEIKHDDNLATTSITNITSIKVTSENQANLVLERAAKNRSTASTKSNERSSRSHSIFILKIHGQNSRTNETSTGTLNLVDLAGSERLNSSQATGERRKETQAINKSLSALGDVIYSLGEKQNAPSNAQNQHVPYRNSKLTYLLKHSLGGNSKTLMFVNMSPLEKDYNESVNSLRFASKVNSTKLQKATSSS